MASRFDYVRYDDLSIADQAKAKKLCEDLELMILSGPASRAQSLALTKLEEVYMWIGKQIRDDQVKRTGSAPLQEERTNS